MYIPFEPSDEQKKLKRKRERKQLLGKWFLTLLFSVITVLPTVFFFGVKAALSPEGFWQQFVVYGVGLYFLGGLQFMFLVVYIGSLINIVWTD